MNIVLLDTTVASLLHPKKRNDSLREKYAAHMHDQTLAISFQSVAELWEWAESNNWSDTSRRGLSAFIRGFLVIPYDYDLAQVWARVMHLSRQEGRRFDPGDCWIAATAVHRQIPLLTHDADFLDRSIADLEVISYLQV